MAFPPKKTKNGFTLKSGRLGLVIAALVLAAALPGAAAQRAGAGGEVLTNESVVAMTTGKLDRDLILTKVNTTRNTFDVTVKALINLQMSNVHQEVIKTMITMAADSKLGQPPSKTPEVLDNQSIIALVTAKVSRAIILAKIQATKCNFDTSSTGLVTLTQGKVPSDVIKAMVAKS